jgi:predicted DsbA family dithiol-disulfide isomerase
MAIVSPKITADVIEAQEYPDLSNQFRVTGVPKIVINDTHEMVGAQREKKFIDEVVKAGEIT